MKTCGKRRRDVAAEAAKNLPGSEGFVMVEYRGSERLQIESRTTDAVYTFAPGSVRYVDAFDWGMLGEDDRQVFFRVDE